MKITESQSLRVSRRVFDFFLDKAEYESEDGFDLDGYIDTFNNCRETGLRMCLMRALYQKWSEDAKAFITQTCIWKTIYIWAFEDRHSDQICVIVSENTPTHLGMYSEESYEKERKFFNTNEYEKAAEYLMTRVKEIHAIEKMNQDKEKEDD